MLFTGMTKKNYPASEIEDLMAGKSPEPKAKAAEVTFKPAPKQEPLKPGDEGYCYKAPEWAAGRHSVHSMSDMEDEPTIAWWCQWRCGYEGSHKEEKQEDYWEKQQRIMAHAQRRGWI